MAEFSAGSNVSVRVPNGLVRKYSLCNDPAERDRYLIAVKREPMGGRGGSESMIRDVRAGSELAVSAPANNFALVKSSAGYLFVAGGIGITPIMAMIRQLKAAGGRFKLYYCTRSPAVTAFRDELSGPEFHGQVTIHHDQGDPARSLDLWPIVEKPKGQQLYCCGPRGLMQAVRDMTGHWSPSAVHFEAFTEAAERKPDDKPFTVRLARTGGTVEVAAGADPRPEARTRFAAEFHGDAYATVEELCGDRNVEAIYIATPHQFHAGQVALVAAAGKHVLVEKPMALSLAECRQMIAATRAAGVTLVVGHSPSFDAPVARPPP